MTANLSFGRDTSAHCNRIAGRPGRGRQPGIGGLYTDNLTIAESFVETTLGLNPTSDTIGEFDTTEVFGELLQLLGEIRDLLEQR